MNIFLNTLQEFLCHDKGSILSLQQGYGNTKNTELSKPEVKRRLQQSCETSLAAKPVTWVDQYFSNGYDIHLLNILLIF